MSYRKAADTAGPVKVGDTIAYTLSATVSNAQTTAVTTLTDTLGTGLTFGSVTNAGVFNCGNSGSTLTCMLPAGTVPGTYTATYTATVNNQARGTVDNAVVGTSPEPDNPPTCASNCGTSTPVAAPAVVYAKTANTAGPVKVGDTIIYTLTATVSNSQTTAITTLTDTLGTGLTFGSVTNAGIFNCSNSGSTLTCMLPAGTVPGTYTATYTATVNNQARGTVDNAVVGASPDPSNPPTCASNCGTSTPVAAPAVSYSKSADTAGPVKVGDTITYTLTATVSNSQTTTVTTLADTLGTGLTFAAVTNAGVFTCGNTGNTLTCTLPAGTVPGTYTATYTATVNNQARGTVDNAVVGTSPDPNNPPTCASNCRTSTPVAAPAVVYAKTANTAGPVKVGDTITYTLTATVSNAQTTAVTTLTDTLGTGLTFGSVTNAGVFNCGNSGSTLTCTLPAATVPGTYTAVYTATVNDQARGTVDNAVVGTSPDPNNPPTCASNCRTSTPVTTPAVSYSKAADTAGPVKVGDTITYTLTATVSNSQTTAVTTLTDTLGTGLTFGSVTNAGVFNCSNTGNTLTCMLPAGTVPGTYTATYTATVNDQARGTVDNAVVGTTPDPNNPPTCASNCRTSTPVMAPAVSYSKSADTAGPVKVGDTITYTLTATVSNSQTTTVTTLADTLGAGLTFAAVTNAGVFTCGNTGNTLTCTLPAGTVPGTYTATYTATVNDQARGSVDNAVVGTTPDPNAPPTCAANCRTSTPVASPEVSYAKAADTPGPVQVGDIITYTLTATVRNSRTAAVTTLTDTLGTGLDFIAVTSAGAYSCSNSGNTLTCTLPANTVPGSYAVTYTARVNTQAKGTVNNAVVGTSPDPNTRPTCATNCGTSTPVASPEVTYAKSADTAGPVKMGDTITYTLTATVSKSQTTAITTLTDTLGTGLTFAAVGNAGIFTCGNSGNTLTCTLPAGTLPGTYTAVYTATVNAEAVGTVDNAVVGTSPDPNTPPTCATNCGTSTPVASPEVGYAKTADTAGPVKVGDTITYTVTATVRNSRTTAVTTLTDTLGTGLDFIEVTNAGAYSCSNAGSTLTCTLPAGTVPGTYSVVYTATVNAQASGTVNNAVVGTAPDPNTPPKCEADCETSTPVASPEVGYAKSADTAGPVKVGDTITYTVTATVSKSQTTAITTLTDTLGTGLTFAAVTNAGIFTCGNSGNTLTCTLPAGTVPGTYPVVYTATVNAQASGTVDNAVLATSIDPGITLSCVANCKTSTPVKPPRVTVAKSADPADGTDVEVGREIRYTLTATVSDAMTLAAVELTDRPGAGLTIGAMPNGCAYNDATITCVLLAGTPVGTYTFTYTAVVNDQAQEFVRNSVSASNRDGGTQQPLPECTSCATQHPVASAEVRVSKSVAVRQVRIGDLVRYTLTVQNVGRGWVRNATVVDTPPAGFTYVEGSLHATDADNQVGVEGQHPLRFTHVDIRGGETATLVYLMRVGAGVRPGTHTNTAEAFDERGGSLSNRSSASVQLVGDPLVDDTLIFGTVFNDCNGNGRQDEGESGVPGVRIASVDGLLMETDRFGRYHLAGVPGGTQERGRNFILKVDPSTLPDGTRFTTDNPLLRRITPGVPVRFDWGVRRCVKEVREVQLGEVMFAPGSAAIRTEYEAAIDKMAKTVRQHGGGEVVIQGDADSESLAFERATAVKQALLSRLDDKSGKALQVSVRTNVNDPHSLVVGVDEGGALLGTVLFDTDKSAIRPEFEPLLDKVAAALEKMGGGSIGIVGHTDVRASYEYNTALGMRRAQAVYEALVKRLSPQVLKNVRVDSNTDPLAPVDSTRH